MATTSSRRFQAGSARNRLGLVSARPDAGMRLTGSRRPCWGGLRSTTKGSRPMWRRQLSKILPWRRRRSRRQGGLVAASGEENRDVGTCRHVVATTRSRFPAGEEPLGRTVPKSRSRSPVAASAPGEVRRGFYAQSGICVRRGMQGAPRSAISTTPSFAEIEPPPASRRAGRNRERSPRRTRNRGAAKRALRSDDGST